MNPRNPKKKCQNSIEIFENNTPPIGLALSLTRKCLLHAGTGALKMVSISSIILTANEIFILFDIETCQEWAFEEDLKPR